MLFDLREVVEVCVDHSSFSKVRMLPREGAERTEPLATGSALVNAPSVGRCHGHLRTWVMPTREDSAPLGLAAIAGRRP